MSDGWARSNRRAFFSYWQETDQIRNSLQLPPFNAPNASASFLRARDPTFLAVLKFILVERQSRTKGRRRKGINEETERIRRAQ